MKLARKWEVGAVGGGGERISKDLLDLLQIYSMWGTQESAESIKMPRCL